LARTELTKTKGFSITKGFGIQQLQELATARGEGSKGNAGKVEENKSEEGNRKKSERNRKAVRGEENRGGREDPRRHHHLASAVGNQG